MNASLVNRKDSIIASAIEIISEAGLASLTTKNLAMKENTSESLLYRYFGGIDEVLVEVVETYVKFDRTMMATIEAKDIPHFKKVMEFFSTLGIYYTNYYDMAAIVLNYEGFLHNVNTRDRMAECILERTDFVKREIAASIEEGEIDDKFSPDELTNLLFGTFTRDLLNRRIRHQETQHIDNVRLTINKLEEVLMQG